MGHFDGSKRLAVAERCKMDGYSKIGIETGIAIETGAGAEIDSWARDDIQNRTVTAITIDNELGRNRR
ncbi:hypothetical protein EVAR_78649_1 [Eumeta japonica]|uniref:Uncharacterized protein n=1 Tax=Eumeta variegata TaxID=151549 RepID=A0A4C1U7T2_EUMVA|nr:hypothetical protein EVAR_78649_1 [Eumeta japonica]